MIELLNNSEYGFTKEEINPLTELAIKSISEDESLVHLSDAAHKLKSILTEDEIFDLISVGRISNELNEDKISIKHLETILIQNLKKISSKIAYRIYTNIPLNILAKAAIAANSKKPVSFEQLTKDFMLFNNLERTYHKRCDITDSFTSKLIHLLVNDHYNDFFYKARKASLYDFIMGYTRLFDIDKKIAERKFSRLLFQKSQDKETAEITLSNFSQAIRRLATLQSDEQIDYKALADNILKNSKQHLINNAAHIDIGKISTGLQELSIEFEPFSQELFHDLRFIILEKGKSESTKPDFINRVIPELTSAASKNDIDVITVLKSYAGQ